MKHNSVYIYALQVTYSTYAGCQLVSGWAPISAPQTAKSETTGGKKPIPPDTAALKGQNSCHSHHISHNIYICSEAILYHTILCCTWAQSCKT